MTLPVRPNPAGGFLRPFGAAWFIREFLLGHAPEGSPVIAPSKGALQADTCRRTLGSPTGVLGSHIIILSLGLLKSTRRPCDKVNRTSGR